MLFFADRLRLNTRHMPVGEYDVKQTEGGGRTSVGKDKIAGLIAKNGDLSPFSRRSSACLTQQRRQYYLLIPVFFLLFIYGSVLAR
jgi:hypothetical protein